EINVASWPLSEKTDSRQAKLARTVCHTDWHPVQDLWSAGWPQADATTTHYWHYPKPKKTARIPLRQKQAQMASKSCRMLRTEPVYPAAHIAYCYWPRSRSSPCLIQSRCL